MEPTRGWKRIKILIDQIIAKFDFENPEKSVKNLLEVFNEIRDLKVLYGK